MLTSTIMQVGKINKLINMKLNKQEIRAIAEKIISNLQESIDEQNKKLKSTESYKDWKPKFEKTPLFKDIKEFSVLKKKLADVKYLTNWGSTYEIGNKEENLKEYLKGIFDLECTPKKLYLKVTLNEVIQEITLKQIGKELDVDSLIKELTAKFSK